MRLVAAEGGLRKGTQDRVKVSHVKASGGLGAGEPVNIHLLSFSWISDTCHNTLFFRLQVGGKCNLSVFGGPHTDGGHFEPILGRVKHFRTPTRLPSQMLQGAQWIESPCLPKRVQDSS